MSEWVERYSLKDGDLSEEDIALEKKHFEEKIIKGHKIGASYYIRNRSTEECPYRESDYSIKSRNHYINKIEFSENKITAICAFCGKFKSRYIGESSGDWISDFLSKEGFAFDDSGFKKEEKSNV